MMTLYMKPTAVIDSNDIDSMTFTLNNVNVKSGSWYRIVFSTAIAVPYFGTGGHFYIEGYRASIEFEWQKATVYKAAKGISIFARSKTGGVWHDWEKII